MSGLYQLLAKESVASSGPWVRIPPLPPFGDENMSEDVMSSGLFAILSKPITNESDREELSEHLYDTRSGLHINYEGTLVYSDARGSPYGISFGMASHPSSDFVCDCATQGLDIDDSSIRPYSCLWYNGVDSDMDMMTLEEYKKMTRLK